MISLSSSSYLQIESYPNPCFYPSNSLSPKYTVVTITSHSQHASKIHKYYLYLHSPYDPITISVSLSIILLITIHKIYSSSLLSTLIYSLLSIVPYLILLSHKIFIQALKIHSLYDLNFLSFNSSSTILQAIKLFHSFYMIKISSIYLHIILLEIHEVDMLYSIF